MPPGFCPICGMPNCTRKHEGRWGWLTLVGFVVSWDLLAPETLSAAFARQSKNPLVVAGWVVLTAHLFTVVPARFDPIKRAFGFAEFLTFGRERGPLDRLI